MSYPTKEEILAEIINRPPGRVQKAIVEQWKEDFYTGKWKDLSLDDKQEALEFLVKDLWAWESAPYDFDKTAPHLIWGVRDWCYIDAERSIYGGNPSIISTLHELGHALDPEGGELSACAYSVGLFKEVFPQEYSRLRWEGHLLVKDDTE